MNINGYVPFLILLYTVPMNINEYVPFLILLYTVPMNINEYVPFLILLYTVPMNINEYVPFLILLYTVPMNINEYVPFLINTLNGLDSSTDFQLLQSLFQVLGTGSHSTNTLGKGMNPIILPPAMGKW